MNWRPASALRVTFVVSLAITMSLLQPVETPGQATAATWTLLEGTGPEARWDHAIAADPQSSRLILFGGRDGEGTPLGDTWVYGIEEHSWTPVTGPAPASRFGHAVAVDAGNRALFLFGGQAGDDFFNDTWRFDLDTLQWSELATSEVRPSPRYGTSAVLDDDGNIIVSHGFTFEGRFDDTWLLAPDTGIWQDVSPAASTRPLKRCLHEAIWDGKRQRMLLFGGCSSGFGPCPQGDLWGFDPTTRTWTDLTPLSGPAARSNPALLHDERSGAVWLIDGLTEAGYVADLWALDAERDAPSWTEIVQTEVAPEPRASHDAVVVDGRVYLFGGFSNQGVLSDLWLLSAATR